MCFRCWWCVGIEGIYGGVGHSSVYLPSNFHDNRGALPKNEHLGTPSVEGCLLELTVNRLVRLDSFGATHPPASNPQVGSRRPAARRDDPARTARAREGQVRDAAAGGRLQGKFGARSSRGNRHPERFSSKAFPMHAVVFSELHTFVRNRHMSPLSGLGATDVFRWKSKLFRRCAKDGECGNLSRTTSG